MHEVLNKWCEVHFYDPQNSDEVSNQILWYNSHIRIDGQIIKPRQSLVNAGMQKIEDLVNIDGEICSLMELMKKWPISWFNAVQILDAIPKMWKSILRDGEDLVAPNILRYHNIVTKKHIGAVIYHYKMNLYNKSVTQYCGKWESMLGCHIEHEDYMKAFLELYKITHVTKYRSFQYCLLLNQIFTNNQLYRWQILETSGCNWCTNIKQTPRHLLFQCPLVKPISNFLKQMFENEDINWSERNLLLNKVHPNVCHVSNLVTLLAKYHIHQRKCLGESPRVQILILDIHFLYNMECSCIMAGNKTRSFHMQWEPVLRK